MTLTHWFLIFTHFILAPTAAIHALVHKRDPRAAFGWITVCVFFPVVGPILYSLFGINRIRTRAKRLSGRYPFSLGLRPEQLDDPFDVTSEVGRMPEEYRELASVSERVTRLPVLGGNHLQILHNGEQAYPAMLEAIEGSRASLYLSTYILESNRTGRLFVRALSDAVKRGVDVRVLVDGMGERYSRPRASRLLGKEGVSVKRFLPPRLLPPSVFVNLRNHRKVLVADGSVAFCGGMNIGDRHLASNLDNPSRVTDIHFKITGPVVSQLEQVFLETWALSLRQPPPPKRSSGPPPSGPVLCRTIIDGPDENIDKFANVLAGAVSAARRNILIMTPYFLPSREIITALQAAALKGVEVDVVLPIENNQPVVHWATRNLLWELLKYGVRVYYQPPPFNHSKLFVVDDLYSLVGSANIDMRSLRLNFELVVEIFDPIFSGDLAKHVRNMREKSREILLSEVESRSLPVRIRDAFCWLFTPYL